MKISEHRNVVPTAVQKTNIVAPANGLFIFGASNNFTDCQFVLSSPNVLRVEKVKIVLAYECKNDRCCDFNWLSSALIGIIAVGIMERCVAADEFEFSRVQHPRMALALTSSGSFEGWAIDGLGQPLDGTPVCYLAHLPRLVGP